MVSRTVYDAYWLQADYKAFQGSFTGKLHFKEEHCSHFSSETEIGRLSCTTCSSVACPLSGFKLQCEERQFWTTENMEFKESQAEILSLPGEENANPLSAGRTSIMRNHTQSAAQSAALTGTMMLLLHCCMENIQRPLNASSLLCCYTLNPIHALVAHCTD